MKAKPVCRFCLHPPPPHPSNWFCCIGKAYSTVLRIPDVYRGSQDRTFSITDPGSSLDKIPDPDPHQRIKILLTQKSDKVFKRKSGMFIPDHGSCICIFFFPDPRARKAPDTGSGSANTGIVLSVASFTLPWSFFGVQVRIFLSHSVNWFGVAKCTYFQSFYILTTKKFLRENTTRF